MSIQEIAQDLFFIPRGYLSGNHFLYRPSIGEGRVILIDTAYQTAYRETVNFLHQCGVDPSDVSLIINTHTHCDHVGGNRLIQELSGCEVALHSVGKHFIERGDDWSTWWRYYNQEADFFTPTNGLEDGDRINIGPHVFEVIYTPGHASDGIILYNRAEKLLISGDTLWEHDMGVMTVRVEGSRALLLALESLDRISALDVGMVYPGHGPSFTNYEEALERAKRRLQGFLDHPQRVGEDLLKKITVYTLLMRGPQKEEILFQELMQTIWFPETVDFYFSGSYRSCFEGIMLRLLERGAVIRQGDTLVAGVKA